MKNKERNISISKEQIEPVYKIYEELKEGMIMYFPDINQHFYLDSDASDSGIGSVIYQDKGIVGLMSKKFNNSQSHYTTIEKEMYAIYYSVLYLKNLISGSQLYIKTDNKNILGNTGDYNKKVERWKAALTEFNIEYQFIQGETNITADDLSRE